MALTSNGQVAAWDGFEAALELRAPLEPGHRDVPGHPHRAQPLLRRPGHARQRQAGGVRRPRAGLRGHQGHEPLRPAGRHLDTRRRHERGALVPDRHRASGRPRVRGLGRQHHAEGAGHERAAHRRVQHAARRSTTRKADTWTDLPAPRAGCRSTRSCSCCPNGKLFDAGPDTTTRTFDLDTKQWATVGTSPIDGQSAVMYRPGKILKSGTWSDPEFPGRAVTNRAAAIDMTAASPAWREVAPMNYRRSYHTLTVLPDGKVLATGGQTATDGVDETTGILGTEIWDPDTDIWTPTAVPPAPAPLPLVGAAPARRPRAAGRRRRVRQRQEREDAPRSTRRPTSSRARARPSPARPTTVNYGHAVQRRARRMPPGSGRCRWSAWAPSRTTSTWTSASSRSACRRSPAA